MEHKRFIGIIDFENEILCSGELLGKVFQTHIGNQEVCLLFPKVISSDDPCGKLVSSIDILNEHYSKDWGRVCTSPMHTSEIKSVLFTFEGTEETAHCIYAAFPKWKRKLATAISAMQHCLFTEMPTIQLHTIGKDGAYPYDGIEILFADEGRFKLVPNTEPYVIKPGIGDLITDNAGLSFDELKEALYYASIPNPISETYILLEAATIAYHRNDYRSTVSLCGSALESAIVYRVKQHCAQHGINFTPMGELGRKYERLKEYGIPIPISNFKTQIINPRNNVVHKGLDIDRENAHQFWNDCKTIIRAFEPSLVENS